MKVNTFGAVCANIYNVKRILEMIIKFTAHELSPIIVDPARARNAGILFNGNEIYRVSQRRGFLQYGQGFNLNKINMLTKPGIPRKIFVL